MFTRFYFVVVLLFSFCYSYSQKTEITKWKDNKKAAISLTFDDGSPNQFSVALPMLNKLKIPATFFVITGDIGGSEYHGKFIGRPVEPQTHQLIRIIFLNVHLQLVFWDIKEQ